MWAASLTRIGIATSLAVAGGLSLVGLLQSLPGKDPAAARDTAIAEPAARLPIVNLREPAAAAPRLRLAQQTQTSGSDALDASLLLVPLRYGPSSGPASSVEIRQSAGAWPPSGTEPSGASVFAAIAPAAGGSGSLTMPQPQRQAPVRPQSVTLPLQQDASETAGLEPTASPRDGESVMAGTAVSATLAEPTITIEAVAAPKAPAPIVSQPAIPDGSSQTASLAKAAVETPAPASPKSAAAAAASDRIGFVIIGSFQTQARADRHAADFAHWQPQVQLKQSAGQVQYRVVVGPFDGADLPAALGRIAERGVPDAWRITLPRPAGAASLPLRRPDSLG